MAEETQTNVGTGRRQTKKDMLLSLPTSVWETTRNSDISDQYGVNEGTVTQCRALLEFAGKIDKVRFNRSKGPDLSGFAPETLQSMTAKELAAEINREIENPNNRYSENSVSLYRRKYLQGLGLATSTSRTNWSVVDFLNNTDESIAEETGTSVSYVKQMRAKHQMAQELERLRQENANLRAQVQG